jgi:hypothetical protein
MKILIPKAQQALRLLLLLVFAIALVLVDGTTGAAKERTDKKRNKSVRLNKPSDIDVYVPFDGNRVYNYIVNNGDLVTDNATGGSGFYWPSVPRTSRSQTEDDLRGENTADYSSGLWIVGTVNDTARTAAVEYDSEFKAGKILPNGAADDGNLAKYRVYKIIKGDGPGIKDWDEWPKADGAPTNANGTPQLTGDQTLWFVMNDLDASLHANLFGSAPLGMEVQTTVFGFNSSGALGDMMFVKWLVINKGKARVDSTFVAQWDDPDLGDASDDFVGCDPGLGLGYVYNADPNDGQYGTNTPALGFDFFQGPIADPDSIDNDADGLIDEPGERLKMTSFVKYTNGAPVGRRDPENVEEVYNYMTGFWQDGSAIIDPSTGRATKFIHSGDPVTRKGDLDFSPGDRRFLMSSGPFTLPKWVDTNSDGLAQVNEPGVQEIVGVKIAAPSKKPSSSIKALRFFDSFAQSAFDKNFDLINAPSPTVEVRRFDQEIVLTWLATKDTVENFQDRGYKFQGYTVYQGASLTGPFTRIATFDLADGLQTIFDLQLDQETGEVLDLPSADGSDAGVQRYISIKNDAIFNNGQRLSNYRDYYFAVTSYIVNLNEFQKVIESPIGAIRVAPSASEFGTSVEAKPGTVINLKHPTGTGDGDFFYKVVDPTQVPNASYTVTWNNDSTPAAQAYTWNLDKNGVRVLSSQRVFGRDSEKNPNDDAPIMDGLQIQILPGVFISPPLKIFAQSGALSRQTVDIDRTDNGLAIWGGGAPFSLPDDRSSTFFGGGSNKLAQLQADLEFRFTGVRVSEAANDTTIVSGGQLGIIRSRSDATMRNVIRLPFELWDVENNVQINVYVTDRNADGGSPWGDRGVPQYFRMSGRDYITPIHTTYNEAALTKDSYSRTDTNATWILFFESGEHAPVSQWDTGDRVLVRFANPTFPGVDTYTFSTTKAVVSGQTDLAKQQLNKINIVPNPYWAHNSGERDPINRFVRLTNLPGSGATIRIFTLAGELVRVIDDAVRAADNPPTLGLQYANWDLRNDAGIPVASGIYIIHFDVKGVGTVVRKAAVVLPEERLDIF